MIIFDLVRNSYVDGPGIRTTVFFKGCSCPRPERAMDWKSTRCPDKCTGCGKCREKCPNSLQSCSLCGKCALYCPNDARELCGREVSPEEVLRELLRDKAYYDASGGGVTFSGGECMLQIDALEALLKLCREAGLHTAVDTAGHVPFAYFEKILPYTDLFLYDIKVMDEAVHRQYTGVGNARILDNLKRLLNLGHPLWIRIPVIPGVNDSPEEMERIRDFLAASPAPEKVELLPYHAMGEHKYAALGKAARSFPVPEETRLEMLRGYFKNK